MPFYIKAKESHSRVVAQLGLERKGKMRQAALWTSMWTEGEGQEVDACQCNRM